MLFQIFLSPSDRLNFCYASICLLLRKNLFTPFSILEQTIDTCVITVPPYYNQAERKALLYSASLAGLTVSQLMDDNTAGIAFLNRLHSTSV